MFETYWPTRFCRDYVELKGSSGQLVNFMATVLGLKPLMDDWVQASQLEAFTRICQGYDLHVRAESIFLGVPKERVPDGVVGRGGITSTSGLGLPMGSEVEGGVHVFISRDPELLRHGMWYPVIVRNRVIWPPRMDLLRYGTLLGYPACCIRFFQKYNDWRRYSFLYEIYRRSERLHPLCNPLGKDRTYAYIYHMPCTFDCQATIAKVTQLRNAIAAHEPGLVDAIDAHLLIPALVLRERKLYFLEEAEGSAPATPLGAGQAPKAPAPSFAEATRATPPEGWEPRPFASFPTPDPARPIAYRSFFYEGSDVEGNVCAEALASSSTVRVEGADIVFTAADGHEQRHSCDPRGFAPEVPFLACFGG